MNEHADKSNVVYNILIYLYIYIVWNENSTPSWEPSAVSVLVEYLWLSLRLFCASRCLISHLHMLSLFAPTEAVHPYGWRFIMSAMSVLFRLDSLLQLSQGISALRQDQGIDPHVLCTTAHWAPLAWPRCRNENSWLGRDLQTTSSCHSIVAFPSKQEFEVCLLGYNRRSAM